MAVLLKLRYIETTLVHGARAVRALAIHSSNPFESRLLFHNSSKLVVWYIIPGQTSCWPALWVTRKS